MLSRLFSNHLKIIKIKDRRLIDICSPQNSSVINNNIFLCYLDFFQTI